MRILPVLLAMTACAPAANQGAEAGPGGEAAAAAGPAAGPPIVLTWSPPANAAFHPMGTDGTLTLDGRCLYLETPAYRFLLVFPEGARWDAAAGGVRLRDQLLRPGTRVSLSGESLAGPGAVAPGFDAQGCAADRVFRLGPWPAR